MISGPILILALITLLLFSIVGLFNKRIGNIMNVIYFYLRRLRANRQNFRKLPISLRKFFTVLRYKRSRRLFLRKIFKRYHRHREHRKNKNLPIQKSVPQ